DIVATDAAVAGGGITFTSSQATGTIRDDDSATITIGDAVVVEGGTLQFPVDLNADVDGGVRLDFATADGTATTVDGDYTPVRTSLTFTTAGRLLVEVPTTADSKVERDERISLSLVAAAPGSPLISSTRFVLPAAPATGTITNDDGAVLSMSDSAVLEGGRLIFAITSSAAVDGGFYVDVTSFDGTARVADSDYVGGGATLLFTGIAGEVRNFIVNSTADTKVEANESLSVELSNVMPRSEEISAGTFELPTAPSVGTILNDDRARFTVADVRASEAGTLTFQVKLASAVDGGASVSFATADGTARTADGDYVGAAGSLSFTGLVGEARDVVVALIDDDVVEADETFTLALSSPMGFGPGLDASAFILPVTPATGTIVSNDTAVLTVAPASTQEGGPSAAGALRFDVTLSKPVQGGLRVAYFTQDGTATVADNDYTPITLSQLTFAGMQGEVQTAVVNVTPDTRPEADETVRLALGAVTPLVAGVASTSITASGSPAVGTIRDDDIIVSVRATTAKVTENGATNLVYRFSRLGSTASSLVVPFAVGGSAIFASDFAASGATSFSTTAGSVTFAA
ncbi:MAG TPA: Calx-beta domain-containing protein, partial [Pirellulaceae bacterium]|nr:Calx-beta domain-containing protein [Pirellulaceae bacterium]